jgi:hypothetical protein
MVGVEPPALAADMMSSTGRERRHHRLSTWDTTRRKRTGHLRAAIATWFHRTTRRSRRDTVRALIPYLRQHWGVGRTRDIPGVVARKTLRAVRGGAPDPTHP